jgi:hypothetical protein
VCPRSSTIRRAAPGESLGRLSVRIDKRKKRKKAGKPRVEVRGKYSTGAAEQTAWLTEDRCDGTLTRVKSGRVSVRDLTRKRTVIVRAGHSYLARAR